VLGVCRPMMEVMIVCPRYGPPWNEGVKNMVKLLEESLSESGVTVTVVSREKGGLSGSLASRFFPLRIIGAFVFWYSIAREARARQVQIVHLFSSVSSVLGIKSFVVRTLSGIPLVVHVTGLRKCTLGYGLLLRAEQVVVGGSYLLKFFPSAIDLPPVSPYVNLSYESPPLADSGVTPSKILFLGAMEAVRGVHTLIDAVAILKTECAINDLALTIAWNGYGDSKYVDMIRTRIAEYDLEDRIQWQHTVENIPALYQTHDLVVIPRASPERMGFPLRVLEAMSYGKPVVASDVGEMPQIVADCGLTYPHEDADALGGALCRLLTDNTFYRLCSKNAYRKVRQYHPSHTIARLARLYEDLAR
jgi:glycosyltransferase involved in cell wall biosynthesis